MRHSGNEAGWTSQWLLMSLVIQLGCGPWLKSTTMERMAAVSSGSSGHETLPLTTNHVALTNSPGSSSAMLGLETQWPVIGEEQRQIHEAHVVDQERLSLQEESSIWKLKARFGNQKLDLETRKLVLETKSSIWKLGKLVWETRKARFGNQESSFWKPTF